MKLKSKMIASIMSICLVCAVFAIGVFALKTANLKIGGDVSFTATGVEAHIKNASVTGAVTQTTLAANDSEGEVINTSMTQADIDTTFANWSDIELDFDENATDIELKFDIANTSTNADNYIEIDYSYSFSNSSPNVDVFPGDENAQSVWENNNYILAPKGATPAAGDYETFTLKFKVLDKELNVPQDTKVNLTIALKHTTPVKGTLNGTKLTTSDGIVYTLNSTNYTASLGYYTSGGYDKGDNSDYSGDANITIAPIITDGENNYIVTTIDKAAFSDNGPMSGNGVINSIVIPNSVTSIESCAFVACSGLTSVAIGKGVTSVGFDLFEGTPWFQNKPDGLVYINHIVYAYKGTISENTSIVLTGGTISIAPAAFYYCIGLTSISIPSSVTSVGFDAFSDCYNLTTAKFNNPTGWFVADSADATSGTPVTVTSEFTEENANVLKGINGLYLLRRDA